MINKQGNDNQDINSWNCDSLIKKREFKPKKNYLTSSSRRENILKIQKERRNELLKEKRTLEQLHLDEILQEQQSGTVSRFQEPSNPLGKPNDLKRHKRKDRRKAPSDRKEITSKDPRPNLFSEQLVVYDWMIEIPQDLYYNWLYCVRPEGVRCLLTIYNNYAISRDKHGLRIEGFACDLSHNGLTLVEAIYNFNFKTYFLLDALFWNDCDLSESTTECRQFFLSSRYQEFEDLIMYGQDNDPIYFQYIEHKDCNYDNLLYDYNKKHQYPTDSILFIHKEGHYLPGFNPLWLCWRDSNLSRFNIDTTDENKSNLQTICLELLENGDLRTADMIIVGNVGSYYWKPSRKSLVKAVIEGIDFESNELIGLKLCGKPFPARSFAEPFNRIVHQHIQRLPNPPITFDLILKWLLTQA